MRPADALLPTYPEDTAVILMVGRILGVATHLHCHNTVNASLHYPLQSHPNYVHTHLKHL